MATTPFDTMADIATISAQLDNNSMPFWSPMNELNADGKRRTDPEAKEANFSIEISNRVWSLWGTLHPKANCFHRLTRGKQYTACTVVACCAASIYPLSEWNEDLLNTIVLCGDEYYRRSLAIHTSQPDAVLTLKDLSHSFAFEKLILKVRIKDVVYGKLYSARTRNKMNIPAALFYFFHKNKYGIVECANRFLAIGQMPNDGGYFMYDCMSKEEPLFPKDEGASYILRTKELAMLVYCITVTLQMPVERHEFHIYSVKIRSCKSRSQLNLRDANSSNRS